MRNREVKMKPLAASILSLSLLTVMAGAAVAPALEVIRRHFSDASQLEVQLVVCMPALFIVITNMFFGRLASRFGARTLTMAGLALYTVGGAAAGLFNSIWAVLVMRALVGVGVGIIMPLSTGLLTYYFAPEKREGLMGLSSAANQLGGVVATLLAGVLANISWRMSFLVYLMGLISIVLCLIFMPNDRIRSGESADAEKGGSGGVWRRNWGYKNKTMMAPEYRHRCIVWGVQPQYIIDMLYWMIQCWGVVPLTDMLSMVISEEIAEEDTPENREQAYYDMAWLTMNMIMRNHTHGGYKVLVDELWEYCEKMNADMVMMWEHMSCKALTGMHGQFEEQARERGINLVWVCHDLADPRVYTRQAIRDQFNQYMRTVMREEPLDPTIEVLPDEHAW